jgi:5-methylcytosine-specific restriction endonuclease McrA
MLDLRAADGCTPEEIGAAFTLLAWSARGHHTEDDDMRRRVCGMARARWRKCSGNILRAFDLLVRASEPRARFGRPTLSKARRDAILARDGAVCRYCGDEAGPFHIDHVEPLARGGSNRDDNLCVACAPCNFAKAAKVGSEWNY